MVPERRAVRHQLNRHDCNTITPRSRIPAVLIGAGVAERMKTTTFDIILQPLGGQ